MKICLTFICRDNKDVIERMLKSCLPIIDSVVAVDTGSKDHTVLIITKFCKKNNLPYIIKRNIWKNFGHNRTLMMKYAEDYAGKNNMDYIFVMDSDETLDIDNTFNKESLFADTVLINTTSGGIQYYRNRIFKTGLNWKWIGYAHE